MHKCVISQKQVTSSYLSFVLTYDKEYTTYLKTTTSLASQQSTVLSINYPIYYITVLDKHHNKYLNWTVHCKLYKIVFSVLLNTSFTLGHILHYIKHQLFLKLLTQCNIRCDLYLINGQQCHWKKKDSKQVLHSENQTHIVARVFSDLALLIPLTFCRRFDSQHNLNYMIEWFVIFLYWPFLYSIGLLITFLIVEHQDCGTMQHKCEADGQWKNSMKTIV